jgi:hypothetical protein
LIVHAELGRFIDLVFRYSEAYWLALKLYTGRSEVIAGRNAADILRQVIAEHIPERDEQTRPEKVVSAKLWVNLGE